MKLYICLPLKTTSVNVEIIVDVVKLCSDMWEVFNSEVCGMCVFYPNVDVQVYYSKIIRIGL